MDCSGLLRVLLRALPQQTQWPKLELSRQRDAHLSTHEPLPQGTCFRAFMHLHPDQRRNTKVTGTAWFNIKLQMPEECHKVDRKNMRELIGRIQFRSRNCCKNITFKTDQKKSLAMLKWWEMNIYIKYPLRNIPEIYIYIWQQHHF